MDRACAAADGLGVARGRRVVLGGRPGIRRRSGVVRVRTADRTRRSCTLVAEPATFSLAFLTPDPALQVVHTRTDASKVPELCAPLNLTYA